MALHCTKVRDPDEGDCTCLVAQKEEKEKAQADFGSVITYLEETIGKDKIKNVEVSLTLKDSPSMLAQVSF